MQCLLHYSPSAQYVRGNATHPLLLKLIGNCDVGPGDPSVRVALFEAAHVMLTRSTKWSSLKPWAVKPARRRGLKHAKVALARKFAVILHHMWVGGTEFRFVAPVAPSA